MADSFCGSYGRVVPWARLLISGPADVECAAPSKGRFVMVTRCILLCVVLAAQSASQAKADGLLAGPEVRIESGTLSGKTVNGVDQFLGIPYAAPATGDLRWRPPSAASPWNGTRRSTEYGNICPQNKDMGVFANAGGAEDCLFLNVFVAQNLQHLAVKRPVLVWIHGGGYQVGHSDGHDGSKLALQGGAVVVTINYRLGALGFLAHPSLDGEGHPFANYGLMDQQFALQWVKRNIAQFGGDPDNVTIFGESSGGTSVMSHIVSPGAKGLFNSAIAQSGSAVILKYPAFGAPSPLAMAEEKGKKFAEAAGCADQTASCMRRLSVQAILSNQAPFVVNQAIVDGTVLPTTYNEAFQKGKINRVTLVNGNNHHEWRWLAGLMEAGSGKPMTEAGYREAIKSYYGEKLAPAVLRQYPLEAYLSPGVAYGSAITDSLFACTGLRVNHILATKVPVYAFEFADETAPSYLAPTSFSMGAAHTLEIQYLFPNYRGGDGTAHELNKFQAALSDRMVQYWSSVSRAGEGRLWEKYSPAADNYLSLISPEPVMRSHRFAIEHKCAFWDKSGLY